MLYKVKYRRIGSWRWRTLRNVEADFTLAGDTLRVFVTKDGARTEVSIPGVEFWFSKERHALIQEKLKREKGE